MAGDANLQRLGDKLCADLGKLFQGTGPIKPSVLHGDLWSGNVGALAPGNQPTIYDPATYYGHSEAEFGMSWCAGFSQDFYRAYDEVLPPAPGAAERRDLYRLYHYLNHLNLFGSGYYGQCEAALKRLVDRL